MVKSNEMRFNIRYVVLTVHALSLIIFGFIVELFIVKSPNNIYKGLINIIKSPDALISDYMHPSIGGIGAGLVNAGLLTLIFVIILFLLKVNISGPTIAAIFTISGFAFFGKNLYNVWFIFLGVFLYSRVQKEKFIKYIIIALFGTAMSPVASELTFNLGIPYIYSIPLGIFAGIFVGFILPPITTHLLKMHQGYNLYNVGFTAGFIVTLFVSIVRSFRTIEENVSLWSEGNNLLFSSYLFTMFTLMIITGFILNGKSFNKLTNIMKYSGRLVSDFVTLEGFGITLVNMGLLGIISTTYILIIGGDLNGPTMGGIFTIVGFAAFGKHPKNVLPIFIGVALASFIKLTWDINDPTIQLAALFGTALAPIAGEFGLFYGILAAVIHSSVVRNVGYLHGGLNLYNNGFSAGIVATVLVPIIEAFRKDEKD